jgi:hypothetical protein
MRPYRDIAAVAGAQVVCFSILTNLEPTLFLIHMYLSIVYIAILVMLFYMEDRWAYMIGMLSSLIWLAMVFASGLFARHIGRLFEPEPVSLTLKLIGALAIVTMILAILMIVFCAKHWRNEYSGLGKLRRTFLLSLGIVLTYYAVLLRWFWDLMPNS